MRRNDYDQLAIFSQNTAIVTPGNSRPGILKLKLEPGFFVSVLAPEYVAWKFHARGYSKLKLILN